MIDKQTPPDWVLIEAAKRFEWRDENADDLRLFTHPGYRALCDMIERYETAPVDRKLLCAREANASMSMSKDARAIYEKGIEDDSEAVKRCVRAIELWEEGFGE